MAPGRLRIGGNRAGRATQRRQLRIRRGGNRF